MFLLVCLYCLNVFFQGDSGGPLLLNTNGEKHTIVGKCVDPIDTSKMVRKKEKKVTGLCNVMGVGHPWDSQEKTPVTSENVDQNY